MKPKCTKKTVVPQGRIWWKAMGQHPLNAMIGQVVNRLRERLSWSLNDLAVETGLAKSYLYNLERGGHSPSFEVVLRLEAVFGLVSGGLQRLAKRWLRKIAGAQVEKRSV